MQYDKEFHLYHNSWDMRGKTVERNRNKERVEEFVRMVCVCVCVCVWWSIVHQDLLLDNTDECPTVCTRTAVV